jgi:hypothetical protein
MSNHGMLVQTNGDGRRVAGGARFYTSLLLQLAL